MKIAFFTNHNKTEFYHALTPLLENMGHEIFWISTSHIWARWLLSRGLEPSQLLDLTSFGPEWASKKSLTAEEESELARLEKSGGLTVNNIILMDRLLSLKPYRHARACLYITAREIRHFLLDNEIEAFFSEATWAQELTAIQVCREIGCRHYAPHTVRIPGDRFGFFEGYMQSGLVEIREPNETDRTEARQFYDYFLNNGPKPGYFKSEFTPPAPRMNWLRKLPVNYKRRSEDPCDEMQPPPGYLVRTSWSEVYNSRRLARADLFESVEDSPARPYVLNTLHVQPESSIDVLGAYCSNQSELIRALARSLPITHDLYVKEHQISYGTRPLEFYKSIKRIPGVRLVDPFSDSHQLIRNADLVVALSGTIAYEAALYGIPAMTVVPMFFGPILTVNGFDPFSESFEKIHGFLTGPGNEIKPEASLKSNLDFLTWILAQTFKGTISDPVHDPECMRPENLDRVAAGLDTILKKTTVSGRRQMA